MMSSPYLKGSPVLVLLKSVLDFSIYLNLCLIVTWISCFVLQSLSRTGSWLNSIPEIGIYTQLSLFPLEVERCWNILTEMSLPKLLIEVLLGIDGTPELSSSVCMHLSHTKFFYFNTPSPLHALPNSLHPNNGLTLPESAQDKLYLSNAEFWIICCPCSNQPIQLRWIQGFFIRCWREYREQVSP